MERARTDGFSASALQLVLFASGCSGQDFAPTVDTLVDALAAAFGAACAHGP